MLDGMLPNRHDNQRGGRRWAALTKLPMAPGVAIALDGDRQVVWARTSAWRGDERATIRAQLFICGGDAHHVTFMTTRCVMAWHLANKRAWRFLNNGRIAYINGSANAHSSTNNSSRRPFNDGRLRIDTRCALSTHSMSRRQWRVDATR